MFRLHEDKFLSKIGKYSFCVLIVWHRNLIIYDYAILLMFMSPTLTSTK